MNYNFYFAFTVTMRLEILWLLFLLACGTGADVHERFHRKIDISGTPRDVTPECLADTSHWMSQLRQGVPWALQMMDSTTKLPTGIYMGSVNHLGSFEQCVKVSVNDEVSVFQGHYCRPTVNITIEGEIIEKPPMMYAFCLPSTCTVEEIPELLENYIGPLLGYSLQVLGLKTTDCTIKQPPAPLPTDAVITVIIVSCLVALVIISAVLEWRLGDKTHPLVRACSLTSTCRSLFNTDKHPADISCLHGLRVGSILWIILGHRYQRESWAPSSNSNIFPGYFSNPLVMTVANAIPSVDTFFVMSGMLMCMSFLRDVRRNSNFDVLKFYIYRYLRLAVPMSLVILVNATVIPMLGDGPLWNNLVKETYNCKVNWWANLLFINNYIIKEGFGQCLPQTWYTAVDMQLAWLSPLILIPLYHSPRAGLQLMSLLILLSCFIPFTVTYIFRFPMSSMQFPIDIPMEGVPEGNFGDQIYNATQCRATPYLCGIVFGYFLYQMNSKKTKLPNSVVYLGWTCSTAVALTIIYSLSIPHQPDYVYDLVGSAFYAGFQHLGWSAVVIWIIFACINNYGGIAAKILSWRMLLPLSRVTYCTFLVHTYVMLHEVNMTRTLTRFTDYEVVHDYFGDLLLVYFLSFVLYVLVEGPVQALLRVIFSKGTQLNKKGRKT